MKLKPYEIMRYVRAAMGMTQAEFASWMGVSSQALVSDWERGVKNPTSQNLELAILKSRPSLEKMLREAEYLPNLLIEREISGHKFTLIDQRTNSHGNIHYVALLDESWTLGPAYRIDRDGAAVLYLTSTMSMHDREYGSHRLNLLFNLVCELVDCGAAIPNSTQHVMEFSAGSIKGRYHIFGNADDRNANKEIVPVVYLSGENAEVKDIFERHGVHVGRMDEDGRWIKEPWDEHIPY